MTQKFLLTRLLFLAICVLGLSDPAMAMGRHVHFVDSNYEGKVIKGQPVGEKGTRFWHETQDFRIIISYPAAHRIKTRPLPPHWITLQVGNVTPKRIKFRLIEWKLLRPSGEKIPMRYEHEGGEEVYLKKVFDGNGFPNAFYCDIPKDVDQLTLDFKIEILKEDGASEIVERTIPLKRTYFKTSFFEGLFP